MVDTASGYPDSNTSGAFTVTAVSAAVRTVRPAMLTMEVSQPGSAWVGVNTLQSRVPGLDWVPVWDGNGVVVAMSEPQSRSVYGDPSLEYRISYVRASGGTVAYSLAFGY